MLPWESGKTAIAPKPPCRHSVYSDMNILLTGSSGRIGSAIGCLIAPKGSLTGLDIVPGEFTTVLGSIGDRKLVDQLVAKADVVIHTAALLTPHLDSQDEAAFTEINVIGTANLLESALAHSIKRFVFTSTTSVYGCTRRPKTQAVWVTEELPPFPEDIYDTSKLAAEALCEAASKNGLPSVVIRMSRCFPEPVHLETFYRLYRGVDERDVARAHWLAATQILPSSFEVFNISGKSPFQPEDCETLLLDPWQIIDRYTPDLRTHFQQHDWPFPTQIDRVYATDKAERLLTFVPEYGYESVMEPGLQS